MNGSLIDLVRAGAGTVVFDGTAWTAAELLAGASCAAAGLLSRGVRSGEAVQLTDDGDGAGLLAVMLGAWWLGARAVVVPQHAGEERTAAIARQSGARLAVRRKGPSGRTEATYTELLGAAPLRRGAAAGPHDVALDVVSSGTTGEPRCVSYTHAALGHNVRAYADRLTLTGQDVLYTSLPLAVAGVLGMVLLPGLLVGAATHLGGLNGADVARAGQQIRAAAPTLVYGVPYTFDLLSRQRGGPPSERLRWAVCSSAPLPEATFDRVRDRLGVPPRSSYCLAEAATVTLNTSDDPDVLRGTVGEPLAGTEVTIEPAEPGAPAGRLVIGGPSCGLGYRRDGTLEPFPGGRVRTNDLGRLDGHTLTVTGRTDELIKVAGRHVDLAHVRRVLGRCPGLGAFAVVVEQHEHLGAVPVVLAEAGSLSVSPRDVIAFCRAELRDVETPREVRVVDRIARTMTGKVPLSGGPVR